MDQKLLFLINRQWTGPALDRFMWVVSNFDIWVPLFIVLILLALWRGGFRTRSFILCTAIIVGVNDGLVSRPLKGYANHPRPHETVKDVRLIQFPKTSPELLGIFEEAKVKLSDPRGLPTAGRSFPSSHTVNTTTVALLAACFYRCWGWLAFIPSLLVGYSRIYAGSHWPSDVLTSIFLAFGTTLLLLCILEWLWRRFAPRLLPAVHSQHPSLLSP